MRDANLRKSSRRRTRSIEIPIAVKGNKMTSSQLSLSCLPDGASAALDACKILITARSETQMASVTLAAPGRTSSLLSVVRTTVNSTTESAPMTSRPAGSQGTLSVTASGCV